MVIVITIDAKCRQYKIRLGNCNDFQCDVFAVAKLLVYAISRIPFSNVYSLESLNFVVSADQSAGVRQNLPRKWKLERPRCRKPVIQYCTHYIALLYLA